jgi:hypothetical protein
MDQVRGVTETDALGRRGGRAQLVPVNRDESRCVQMGRELEDADYRYREKSTKISFTLLACSGESAEIPLYPN